MIKIDENKFGKPLYVLFPGDYFASGNDCILGSVAGATVCICLYDYVKEIGGMGHFIIPGTIGTNGIFADEIASHGIASIEYLMAEMVKLGGDRKNFHAKLFGAGNVVYEGFRIDQIVASNIRFLKEYFAIEKIPVKGEDLGGNLRRKIYFYTKTGAVLRRFQKKNEDSSEFVKLEQAYIDNIFKNKPKTGQVYIFG